MLSITVFLQKTVFCQIVLLLFSSFAASVPVPLRLDLYDASDNHLMYITFDYDADGRNTGRHLFMPDETFIRSVVISYDDLGRRLKEVSYNFNGDTIYVTSYSQASNGASFIIQDQFGLDLTGDRVVYSNDDPLNFSLVYGQTGEQAAAVTYTGDAASGQLRRVDITGQSDRDSYYGLVTYGEAIGVSHSGPKAGKLPQVSIQSRAARIDVVFNLRVAGNVRCELLTLSGRRAAMLFNGRIPKGSFSHRFNPDEGAAGRLSGGIYLVRVSVNGTVVSHSRYLHHSSRAGGVQ